MNKTVDWSYVGEGLLMFFIFIFSPLRPRLQNIQNFTRYVAFESRLSVDSGANSQILKPPQATGGFQQQAKSLALTKSSCL